MKRILYTLACLMLGISAWAQNVAKIGDAEYATLAEAVAAATDGQTVTVTANCSISSEILIDKTVNLDLNGKTVTTNSCSAFQVKGGKLNLTGSEGSKIVGEPSNYKLIYLYGSTDAAASDYSVVNVGENVTVDCTNGYAVMLSANGNSGYGVKVNVDGTTTGAYGGLYVNGSITKTNGNVPEFTVGEKAQIISTNGTAIYAAGYAEWSIAGNVTGKDTGIEIRAGKLDVTGGTIIGNGEVTNANPNGNGTTAVGAGIAVAQHTTKLPVDVKVSGGTIKGYTAFYQIDAQSNGEEALNKISLDITGGTFETINGGTNAIYSENKSGFVSGGTFNAPVPEEYCEEGFKPSQNPDGTYGVTEKNYVAQIGDKKYESLAEAIAEVQNGETVTLLADATANAMIEVSGKNITLDLNGKTVSPVDGTKISGGLIGVHNGAGLTIDDSSADKTGKITSGNSGKVYAAVQVTVKGDADTEPAKLIVNNGNLEGYYYAIAGNGARHNTEITINDGTFKGLANSPSTDDMGLAIFHPQDGKLTINGGEFEGPAAGVEIRAGELNISGGSFKATATEFKEAWNGSGSTVVGAALAISQHSTNKDIKVNITGGTFEGIKAVYEVDLNTATGDKSDNIDINIEGGTFTGAVASENVQNFISGGTFNAPVPEEYCEEGFIPENNGDGTYGVKNGSYVAQIGNVKYESLADAIAAVPTDGTETTIKVLENVDLTAALTIANTKNVKIDLNGKTIKNDASKSLAQLITVNGKLTINDSSEPSMGVIKNTASAKYVIKTGTAASILTLNKGTIETTTGNGNGAVYGTYGSFVMTGGKIIAAGTGVTSKNVTISGGEITATAGQALCAAGTITGGKFTSINNSAVYANQSGTLEISGGEFTGVSSKPTINIYTTDVKVTGAILNNGVGFASNSTAMLLTGTDEAYLANTHAAFYDGETLLGYAPINTGLLASTKVSGKTVKLTKDVATTTYLNVTKSFTLDLNGHNIACAPAKADATILTKGTASAPVELTIKGEGNISCADHGEGSNAIQVSNYATVNIEGGKYSVPSDNATIYMLATVGKSVVNISGGKFESGDGKYVLNIKDNYRDYNTFNVTGGEFYNFDPANISNEGNPDGNGTNYVPDGYITVMTESDYGKIYTVEEGQWVASITDEAVKKFRYTSLDEAIDDAKAVDKDITITLLSDAETEKETLPANVTINASGKELTMPSFVVLDGEAFTLPNVTGAETYKVRKATYIRTNISATEWGTVCLPFSLTSGNGADYYTYNNISGSTLTVDETTTVAPNIPVVFKKAKGGDLEINEENAIVSLVTPETLKNGALVGTYETTDITADGSIYFINGDQFHKAQVSLKVPAYRAYINYTAPAGGSAPRALSLVVGGGDDTTAIGTLTTGDADIEAIYDAAGRKLQAPQKGMNIMKLANGKTVKLVIK